MSDIPITISIKKQSKILFFKGVIGDSQQILLYSMYPPPRYGDSVRISKLPTEKMILDLYDYLEVLGTGDGVANFITEYNHACRMKYVGKQLEILRIGFLNKE